MIYTLLTSGQAGLKLQPSKNASSEYIPSLEKHLSSVSHGASISRLLVTSTPGKARELSLQLPPLVMLIDGTDGTAYDKTLTK